MGHLARAFSFQRRSFEPTNLKAPAQWLLDLMNGGPSKAGVPVNETTATRLTAVWCAVRILSETLGSLPLNLYERQEPRGRVRVKEHDLADILHLEPNPDMSSFFFRESLQAQVVLHGNAYGPIVRDRAGRVRELWPLTHRRVEPKRDKNGDLKYAVKLADGKTETLNPIEILHVPGLSFNGLTGRSVLGAARDAIGLGLAVQDYGSTFFGRGGRVPGVLKTQSPKLDPDTRMNVRESWLQSVGGADNWHMPAILPRGMEYQQIGITPEDGQFLETKKFQVTEIARIFRVPPHLLYDLEKATFSNIEQMGLEFVMHTARPWLVRWEQEFNRKLLTREERARGLFIEFNLDAFLRGDTAARGAFYALGRNWGWLSANDIRDRENLPDLGPQGDPYLVPFNMANAEELLDAGGGPSDLLQRYRIEMARHASLPPAPAPRASEIVRLAAVTGLRGLKLRRRLKAAARGLIEDRARLIVNREIGAIEKEIQKLLGQDGRNRRNVATLRTAIEEFYASHAAWAEQRMRPMMASYAGMVQGAIADELGKDPEDPMPDELQRFLPEYVKRFGLREASESRLQLLALTQKGDEEEVGEAIRTRLAEWEEKRPGKIAVQESTQFMAAAAKVLYVAAGVTVLRWVANPGACPYCKALDGWVTPVQNNFVSAGQGIDGGPDAGPPMVPSENIGHPPAHNNCLPGNSRVSPCGAISASSERRYDGELFVFRTASGKQLSCTPNHPILTDRGWVAAETLDVGDHAVSSRARQWNPAEVGDDQDVPATIEQVARAFGETPDVIAVPMPVAAEEFHGDGRTGEVAVIRTHRKLLREAQPALLQQAGKGALQIGNTQSALLSRQGSAGLFGKASRASADGLVCSRHHVATTLISAGGPNDQLGFSRSAPLNAALYQALPDRPTIDAERLGQGELALAGDVFLDQVVHVERHPFHGLVYNLQTSKGYYIAEGIVCHNCECDIVAD